MTEQENQKYAEYLKSPAWARIARRRMEIDGYECCMCGSRGTASNQLEVHHISYAHLFDEENRIYQDLETVCHACHKSIHRAMERVTGPDGRRGWKDNPRIPKIHVFTISGADQGIIEEE